jgi:hypothetical protein
MWLDEERLRTRHVCHAVARHPVTGQEVWFNQMHLFHPSALGAEHHRALLDIFGEDDLPRNAMCGDGTPIDSRVLDAVREAFDQETVTFSWERGDLLLLDNMLVAHARTPYTGPRQVLVAMADSWSSDFAPSLAS